MNELVQRTMGELCFESELDKFRQSEDPQESNPQAHKKPSSTNHSRFEVRR